MLKQGTNMDLIDNEKVKVQAQLGLAERMLKNQLEIEITEFITDMVMPEMEEKIKQIAKEAVSKWSVKVQYQKEMQAFGNVDKVLVRFVENVIESKMRVKVPNIEDNL